MIFRFTLFCLFWQLLPGVGVAVQDTKSGPFEDRVLPALFNEKVQNDLELVDEQKSRLTVLLNLLKDQRDAAGKALKQLNQDGASAAEIQAKRNELVAQLEFAKAETKSGAMEILLPHQQERLRQVTNQLMLREIAKSESLPSSILTPQLKKYLDLDDSQADRIEKKAIALKKELEEQIRKLADEAQQELLQELTAEQRAKYDKFTGESTGTLK